MTLPRFDDHVKYLIPAGLYKDIMSLLGMPRPVLCSHCEEEGYWVSGDMVKSLLDLLNESGDESSISLSAELFQVVSEPEPDDPVELQEVE